MSDREAAAPTPRTDAAEYIKGNSRIDDRGCWIWMLSKNSRNYGLAWNKPEQKVVLAHRLSYSIFIGPIPDGHHVLHRCDTPHCVNPAHLFTGTDRDNLIDCINKGRRPKTGPTRGDCKNASLTKQEADKVKHAIASRTGSLREVANETGISYHIIKDISRGRSY